MKDRVYLALAVVGFIIIVFICVNNQDGPTNYEYDVGGAYTPVQRDDMGSAAELYQQLIGSRVLTCPVVEMSKSKDTVPLSNVVGAGDHIYGVNYMFVEQSLISNDTVNPTLSEVKEPLNLSDKWDDKTNDIRIADLFTSDAPIQSTGECFKLLAPFSFSFENVNVSSDGSSTQTIILNNAKGNCRITFSNVANWFCAGPYGTTTRVSASTDGIAQWEEHYTAHHTIIGNSGNATVKGGYSGYCIGYGTGDTTIKIEKYSNGKWIVLSLEDFIKGQ